MDENTGGVDEGFAAGIFSSSSYISPNLPNYRDSFLPWHKPRKQFVRDVQWCSEIKNLLDNFRPEDNVLRYLGLPGEDLLDLRFFHDQICEPRKLKLKYLGFNNDGNSSSERGADLHVSLHEVNRLAFVSEESLLMPDNFCSIGDKQSIASKQSREMGPFDVINLDLCDGIGKQSHEFLETHYSTLSRLMILQALRKTPWLLFITTRTGGHKQINDQVFEILKKIYRENLNTCVPFKAASVAARDIGDAQTLDAAIQTGKVKADVFLVALCKWIATMGIGLTPKAKAEVQSVYGYKVYGGSDFPDMTSLSIKITPTDIGDNDKHGLAKPDSHSLDECEIAVQALSSICDQKDVDEILFNDPTLKQKMIETAGTLLESARFDREKYLSWAVQF